MDVKIEQSWKDLLEDEFEKPYFAELIKFVKEEYKNKKIFPPGKNIFKAFDLCPADELKVVILGQDPYHKVHGYNAMGLSFGVNEGDQIPPSLKNIFKELHSDLGVEIPKSGNLERWAKQGVLLLNATLTVIANQAGSHQGKGWEIFTDEVIKRINDNFENIVFVLWGAFARSKSQYIDKTRHCVIESAHPSPFSADHGFFGSKPFSKANKYLLQHGLEPIQW